MVTNNQTKFYLTILDRQETTVSGPRPAGPSIDGPSTIKIDHELGGGLLNGPLVAVIVNRPTLNFNWILELLII